MFLANRPYSARKDQKNDHVQYGMCGLIDMKDMTMVLGGVMRPESHRQVFRVALQFAVWYKALVLEKRKRETPSRKNPPRAGLRARRSRLYSGVTYFR